jgi:uncharacterized membrane protein (UPF0127 family)
MKAFNIRNSKELSNNVAVADSLLKRMKGLLGKEEMLNGEALWIKPCMSIHTFLMGFPIDVIFLNRRNQVIAAIRNLKPNRLTKLYLKSSSVLELPAGVFDATDTRVGDEIEIS